MVVHDAYDDCLGAKLRSNAPSCEVDVRLLVRAGWSYEG